MAKKRKDKGKSKLRTDFRKNYESRSRSEDLTREFNEHGFEEKDTELSERVSGKGELTRKRTIIGAEAVEDDVGLSVHLDVDEEACKRGVVLRVHGRASVVIDEAGKEYECATRGLLKTLSTDLRHVVAAGDRVWFRPEGDEQGMIERVDPRHGVLSRTSRGRQHVIVANVDQIIVVGSAAMPTLKPNLIDRFLVTAEKAEIEAIICINKIYLIDAADLQPLVGVYGQLGYQVVLSSAIEGQGVNELRQLVKDKQSVFTCQSGVGKSALLNAVEDGLNLRVSAVSSDNQKGRHTTTAAQLVPLQDGGHVVDTPGIRQFQLWDVIPSEVGGFFRDFRPFVSHCRFPDCTHTHEESCAVKDAVAFGMLDTRRYESYCNIITEE